MAQTVEANFGNQDVTTVSARRIPAHGGPESDAATARTSPSLISTGKESSTTTI